MRICCRAGQPIQPFRAQRERGHLLAEPDLLEQLERPFVSHFDLRFADQIDLELTVDAPILHPPRAIAVPQGRDRGPELHDRAVLRPPAILRLLLDLTDIDALHVPELRAEFRTEIGVAGQVSKVSPVARQLQERPRPGVRLTVDGLRGAVHRLSGNDPVRIQLESRIDRDDAVGAGTEVPVRGEEPDARLFAELSPHAHHAVDRPRSLEWIPRSPQPARRTVVDRETAQGPAAGLSREADPELRIGDAA